MKARLFAFALITCLSFVTASGQGEQEEYIVVLKEGQSIAAINNSHSTHTLRQIPDTSIYLIASDKESDTESLRRLKADQGLESVDTNTHMKLRSSEEASLDPGLVQQMASLLDGTTLTTFYGTAVLKSYTDQPAVYITELNKARNLSTGAAARVAYIDTGADFYHPALQPWLDPGVDLVSNRTASELDGLSQAMASLLDQQMASLLDKRFLFLLNQAMASLLDGGNGSGAFPSELGHGTLVAGIIHLFAPEARIVPIRAFDASGNTTLFTIVDAVYRAKSLNVDVLNMSFSINEYSGVLRKAIADVQAAGIVTVASVGNDASDSKDLYPAAYPGVVGVAATDFNDRLAGFSNFGASVSVSAPGAYIISTVPGGRYAAAWGTSFSAPVVSGTIALLSSRRGHGQAESALALTTADFIDNLNPGFEKKLGKGRINVRRALATNSSGR
jgi:subtilisin family serine protease